MSGVRLIPLQCPRCDTPVLAKLDEVAWVCEQCGQGMKISDERGTDAMDVFFSAALPQNKPGFPYWVARGAVRPLVRSTYHRDSSEEMNAFWATPRLFYVPAYALEIEKVVAAGVSLLHKPVRMEPGARTAILPVVLPPEDVFRVAEFVVMSVEADRRDALKEFKFDLKLDPVQLWILP
ncbi:MAG: hypothetical protein HY835_01035 [Anaerolineae bacterium]|nr:hypothetical protein [Anaerolineae bacterium]